METNFSFHAYKRVLGRMSMSHRELAEHLDADLVINIGQETNNNKVHKLFYSTKDKICFVAIQDVKTGTVVTVLPIDYHENICWAVSVDAQSQAKSIVAKEDVTWPNVEILNTNATVFRISGTLVDSYGKHLKNVSLGSWPCEPYEHSIDALIEDKQFVDCLVDRMKEKINDMEKDRPTYMQTIAIRIGSRGEPVFFSTSEVIESNA